jgi:phosphoserine aminotransferase
MERVYNFSPGPSMLPLPVLERAQKEMLNYGGSGMSVMEMSHRSKLYEGIVKSAEASLRELMGIPDDYAVLFLQGGATMQFAQVAMNLGVKAKKADYIDSGNFASNAIKEAKKYVALNVVASSKEDGYRYIPQWDAAKFDKEADYLHITTNNTVYGTHYTALPDTGDVPLVADMSSNILAEVYDVSKFGLIYAGAQKNAGIAGVTIVIVRKDLMGQRDPATFPGMFDYAALAKAGSLMNTPCTYGIYIGGLVFDYLKELGGVAAMEKINKEKAKLIYGALDDSDFFKPYACKESRSLMNVTFHAPTPELDAEFIKLCESKGVVNVKGYRTVGGMRASMYNAMPIEGVAVLVDCMRDFEAKNK